LEDEAALDQGLAPLTPRQVTAGRLGGGRVDEALLVRKLHHLIAERASLPEELLDVRPLEVGGPAQRRAQNLDLLEQSGVGDRRGGDRVLIEYLHAAFSCFCTSS